MLVLKVTMMEGRTVDQKRDLVEKLSRSASHCLRRAPEETRVIIYEVSKENWGIGGHAVAAREEMS